jgi:hypothetical protein
MASTHWTDANIKTAVTMRRAGDTYKDIAAHIGKTEKAVRVYLHTHGFARGTRAKPGPGNWSQSEEQKLILLFRSGEYSVPRIADILGKSFYATTSKVDRLIAQGLLSRENPHRMIRKLCASITCDRSVAEYVNKAHGINVPPARVREIRQLVEA